MFWGLFRNRNSWNDQNNSYFSRLSWLQTCQNQLTVSVTKKVLQPLWNQISLRTNNCFAYSNYSYSGIGPKERSLRKQTDFPPVALRRRKFLAAQSNRWKIRLFSQAKKNPALNQLRMTDAYCLWNSWETPGIIFQSSGKKSPFFFSLLENSWNFANTAFMK